MSDAPAKAAGDPLHNTYTALRADLDDGGTPAGMATRLAAVTEALKADGWQPGSRFTTGTGHADAARVLEDLRKDLDVAAALAILCLAPRVGYRFESQGGGWHRFEVEEAGRPLVLFFQDTFLQDDLLERQAGVYVETLIRHLRAAGGAGQALRVRSGCMERVPLTAGDGAPSGGDEPA